jgi:hypothetical protein
MRKIRHVGRGLALFIICSSTSALAAPFLGSPIALPGRIEAEHYDTGGQSVAYWDSTASNAYGIQPLRDNSVDYRACADASGCGYYVGKITAGEWLTYTVSVPSAGSYAIDFRYATAVSARMMSVLSGTSQLGTITFDNTGDWAAWQTKSLTVSLPAGTQVLKLLAGTGEVNLNYLQVRALSTSTPTADGPALLPRTYLSTSYPAPTGTSRAVRQGDDLQAVINAAQPGDTIVIDAAATFKTDGGFVLPAKTCTKTRQTDCYITIRTSAIASLPPEGQRVTRAHAQYMPNIVTTSTSPAFRTSGAAHHYRLVGLEVTADSSVLYNNSVWPGLQLTYTLVQLGDLTSTSVSQLPYELIIDRSYIHGHSNIHLKRGIGLDSRSTSIVDSIISDVHGKDQDTQAIAGFNGPGPYRIVNNYLEGAGENVIFGGADPAILNLVPSDIEIRRNHFFKPPSWKGVWLVKNLFELKSAQRVLVEGNIFDGCWKNGQTGYALLYKSVDQVVSGPIPCPWCVVQDVTTRYNIIRNVAGAFSNTGQQGNPDIRARKLSYRHNVAYDMNVGIFTGDTRYISFMNGMKDVKFEHNTMYGTNMQTMLLLDKNEGWPELSVENLSFNNNVLAEGTYGINCPGPGFGENALIGCAPNWTFAGNVIFGTQPGKWRYPVNNQYANGEGAVGFSSVSGKNFRLISTSPYKGDATDKTDPGANIDQVTSMTSGVISGSW